MPQTTTKEKIRLAWERTTPNFENGRTWRAPVPCYTVPSFKPPTIEEIMAPVEIAEFRLVYGTLDNRPWYRIYGRLNQTEIIIKEGPRHL